jgi:hypothetical protein
MGQTGIQTTPNPPSRPGGKPTPTPQPQPSVAQTILRALTAVASLRLTVVLFSLALLLVFLGTLAQKDAGNWTVVNQYFRNWWVMVPFQTLLRFGQTFLFVPDDMEFYGAFPFPGGWSIGTVLMVNLLAAHFLWFFRLVRSSRTLGSFLVNLTKRSGIIVLHFGIVLLMTGELITGLYAVEGSMTIPAKGSANYVEVHNSAELAVVRRLDSQKDDVVAVPDTLLRKRGLIRDDELPFDVKVVRYLVNSALADGPPDDNPANAGLGRFKGVIEKKEGAGVSTDQRIDMPAAYITLVEKDSGREIGTYLVSIWLQDQKVEVGGQTYEIALRFKRIYKPYTIYLEEFHHDVFLGTDKAKNYASDIRLVDPTTGEDREVNISMNDPLRYGGETFYQQSFLENDAGTILQVVRNPAWELPYISCTLVALGMLVHFGIKLIGFIRLRLV